MLTVINHRITLSVRDLEEAFRFYTQVFACRPGTQQMRRTIPLAGLAQAHRVML
jgi:catechol 2,3-dioxygenase-like lactoylglutathione lyase family enzyme